MKKFHIKKILVSGAGHEDAVITFSKGLNVISGPSNTGKSCVLRCIYYCFGGQEKPFDDSFGYTTIKLFIEADDGELIISRELSSNKAEVTSNVDYINSDTYFAGTGKSKLQPLSEVFLSLIGIDEPPQVFKNKRFETNTMSWRMISPLYYLDEDKVGTKQSVLLPEQNTAKTAFLSSLIFLLHGKSSNNEDAVDSKEVKTAKLQAIQEYAHAGIEKINARLNQLEEFLSKFQDINIEGQISSILEDLQLTEQKFIEASNTSSKLYANLDELKQKQAADTVLFSRYEDLKTQLISDLNRLSFIHNGEMVVQSIDKPSLCPFCDAPLTADHAKSHKESLEAELAKVVTQLNGLESTLSALKDEMDADGLSVSELQQKISSIQALINKKLAPSLSELKGQYQDLKNIVELRKEKAVLEQVRNAWHDEINDWLNKSEKREAEYHPKDILGIDFSKGMTEIAKTILKETCYSDLETVRFNMTSFDLDVNGAPKSTFQGKGYRAFINTVQLLTMRRYLLEKAKYAPGILLIDTPFLGLDEGISEENISDSMKIGMFTYFLQHQDEGQLIVVENTEHTPNFDYEAAGAELITFTKNPKYGRYGFLPNIH